MGIVGGLIISIPVGKSRKFKEWSLFVTFLTILTFVAIQYCVSRLDYAKYHWLTCLLISLNGFFCIGIFSLCYEFAAEVSPRVGESISGGLINMTANVLGFIFVMVIDEIIANFYPKNDKMELAVFMDTMYGTLAVAFFLLLLIK